MITGHLFIAVSSIINLNTITATELQSDERDPLKTSQQYSNWNEEKSCKVYEEDILTKINTLGTVGLK